MRSFLEKQTVAFNIKARVDFKTRKRARMGVWEAIELLNTLIDESDPDVRTSPSPFLLELMTLICRLTRPKLNTCYKLRKLFEETENQNGCK